MEHVPVASVFIEFAQAQCKQAPMQNHKLCMSIINIFYTDDNLSGFLSEMTREIPCWPINKKSHVSYSYYF